MSRTYHHGDKAKARQYGRNWRWFRATPSEWNRLHHTKPKRQQERRILHRVIRGEYEQVWPLGSRKPHVYYW